MQCIVLCAGFATRLYPLTRQRPKQLLSIGIYVFRAEIRSQVQQYVATGRSTDRSGDLMAWLHTRIPLYAFRVSQAHGVWLDIGTPTAYQLAKNAIKNKARS